jgi:hypothetical protein
LQAGFARLQANLCGAVQLFQSQTVLDQFRFEMVAGEQSSPATISREGFAGKSFFFKVELL